ncbi:MAG: protein kinase, partial [Lentisphaeria bacterium]|nr:protein kinase [Lentisphaeria bacterium]
GPDGVAEADAPADDDLNKTIAPKRHVDFDPADDRTMPGRRDRQSDGRFCVGDVIMGRYKILSELGQGGMGVVYKCFDETAGVVIALKALPPELSHDTLEMEDIKANFQLVARLVHQNIAISKNLEYDNSNGNYYLIMEYVAGEDLRSWIRHKRRDDTLNLESVLPVIRQVAEALDYAHEQKIIHRDIKPGNIMIDSEGQVKVLDFGLAAQIHTSMTRVSMAYHGTSGTGPYMAPEQWRGRAQGAAADQYALAAMTYEMLAGHLPFEGSDPTILREAVLNDTPEELKNMPGCVRTAVTRAMSKEPAERFASCVDFVAAMEGKKFSGSKTKSGNYMWVVVVAVIVLAELAGFYYGHYRHAEAKRIAEEKRIEGEKRIASQKPRIAAEKRVAAEKRQIEIKEEQRGKEAQQAGKDTETADGRKIEKQPSSSSMSPKEKREEAARLFEKAEELLANYQAKPEYLRNAIRHYQETIDLLDQFDPKPDEWSMAKRKLAEAEVLMKKAIQDSQFNINALYKKRDYAAAVAECSRLMQIMDPEHRAYAKVKDLKITLEKKLLSRKKPIRIKPETIKPSTVRKTRNTSDNSFDDEQKTEQVENKNFPETISLPDGTKLEMAKINAGSFMMGSPEGELGGSSLETPHRAKLTHDYWLGKYEVTQGQYRAVMGTIRQLSKKATTTLWKKCRGWMQKNSATS